MLLVFLLLSFKCDSFWPNRKRNGSPRLKDQQNVERHKELNLHIWNPTTRHYSSLMLWLHSHFPCKFYKRLNQLSSDFRMSFPRSSDVAASRNLKDTVRVSLSLLWAWSCSRIVVCQEVRGSSGGGPWNNTRQAPQVEDQWAERKRTFQSTGGLSGRLQLPKDGVRARLSYWKFLSRQGEARWASVQFCNPPVSALS